MTDKQPEALVLDLRKCANEIEDELSEDHVREVGDASDCASPIMRDAATWILAAQQRISELEAAAREASLQSLANEGQ